MDIENLEDIRVQLHQKLSLEKLPLIKFNLLNTYFNQILYYHNNLLSEAYITEFIPIYVYSLTNFNPIGINPLLIKSDMLHLEKFVGLELFSQYNTQLTQIYNRIKSDISTIESALSGLDIDEENKYLSFPVNIRRKNTKTGFGQIETFTVHIQKNSSLTKNKFLTIPSYEKIDESLNEQIKISWDIAIKYLKRYYKKPNSFHEVVLVFSHKFANIEGYSLGLAITLGFIQELFKFYNTSLSLTLNGTVTFTGGFNHDQKVKAVGNDIIELKTETVFYSKYNYFALPEVDANAAKKRLTFLKEEYPHRKLKIINIEDFDDLINYRQIIKIEKAKIIERSLKFITNNALVLFLSTVLLLIIGFYSIYNFDNNPEEFEIVNSTVHIVNKRGKILWSANQPFNGHLVRNLDEPYVHRIYDVNNDGINEVILAAETNTTISPADIGRIACFNNYGELLWKYKFQDSISTKNNTYDNNLFHIYILDIVKEDDKTILLAYTRHLYSPSAIFKLDIKTGKRLEGTLWSQGHFNRGVTGDFDGDGKTEIITGGINNAMESAFALLIDLEELNGQTPNKTENLFNNIPIAKFKDYLLIGKSDLCRYLNWRFNVLEYASYNTKTNEFMIGTLEGNINQNMGIIYRIKPDFSQISTQIGDDFQFTRDSLVIKGHLKPPLTGEKKYSEQLINGIKEWNGKKFVDYFKKN